MKIEDKKSIREIQADFSSLFPYLKIEFYDHEHNDHEGSPNKYLIKSDKLLRDIRSIHTETDLEVKGSMSAKDIEREFNNTFGLNIQVFRKSRGLWLQTITTDDLTLDELNRRGKIAAEGYKI